MASAIRRDKRLARMMAIYNSFAFHNPGEIPDDPASNDAVGGEADAAMVRAALKTLVRG